MNIVLWGTLEMKGTFFIKWQCRLPQMTYVSTTKGCVCVCMRVVCVAWALSSWRAIQWQPLLQSCCNPGSILTFVLSGVQKKKQSAVLDIYFDPHSQQKISFFSVFIFPILSCLPGNKAYIVYWACCHVCFNARVKEEQNAVHFLSSFCYSFVYSFCLFMLARLDFSGIGVLMWWHARSAAWWRMGWRRTSNRTINAAPGDSVQELRECLFVMFPLDPDSD